MLAISRICLPGDFILAHRILAHRILAHRILAHRILAHRILAHRAVHTYDGRQKKAHLPYAPGGNNLSKFAAVIIQKTFSVLIWKPFSKIFLESL
jgi:hypothetical protein